nr:MAG TPA: hypothetical protein [Caudoviricetes sp.]
MAQDDGPKTLRRPAIAAGPRTEKARPQPRARGLRPCQNQEVTTLIIICLPRCCQCGGHFNGPKRGRWGGLYRGYFKDHSTPR